MRILVITASRHGATTAIGDVVSEELRSGGHEVFRHEIAEKDDVAATLPTQGYDVAVLGGSVYTGTWLSRATKAQALLLDRGVRTYSFAVGVLDVTQDVTDPRWAAPRTIATADHRVTFGGRIDRSGLSLREKSLLAMVRAREGEYTDWDSVQAWAGAVVADLGAASAA